MSQPNNHSISAMPERFGVMSEYVAMELVKAWSGLKHPPRWLYCAMLHIPYKVDLNASPQERQA